MSDVKTDEELIKEAYDLADKATRKIGSLHYELGKALYELDKSTKILRGLIISTPT